jgi:hypothetical protein
MGWILIRALPDEELMPDGTGDITATAPANAYNG